MKDSPRLDLEILRILNAQPDAPVGSSTLVERLGVSGTEASEPSVGRALRRLDRAGLTVRVSNRGRVLTPRGRSHALGLRDQDERSQLEDRLLEVMRPRTVSGLLDLLVVRRALERETARLAARAATPADIAGLEAESAAQADSVPGAFHEAVARASGNAALVAILGLISNEQIHTRLRAILEEGGHARSDRTFSRQLVAAIKAHDSETAERVMVEHFESMLTAIARQTTPEDSSGHHPSMFEDSQEVSRSLQLRPFQDLGRRP